MFCKRLYQEEKGFTLLEVVLGSFILGVLAVAVLEYWAISTETINYITSKNEAIESVTSSINKLKNTANRVRKNNSDWNIYNDLDFWEEVNKVAGTEQVGKFKKIIEVNELDSTMEKAEARVEVNWSKNQEKLTTVLSYTGLKTRRLLTDFQDHEQNVLAVALSPDGSKAVSAGDGSVIKVWDVESGIVLNEFMGHTDKINTLTFSLGGDLVISGSSDGTVKVWDINRNKLILDFAKHSDIVWDIDLSADGTKLATASSDGTVKVWELSTGDLVEEFTGHNSTVRAVAFGPAGDKLVSGDYNGKIKLWNLKNNNVVKFNGKEIIRGLAFTPDGTRFISVGSSGHTVVWDVEQEEQETSFGIHSGTVYGVDVAADGDLVVTGSSDDSEMKIWQLETGDIVAKFNSEFGNFNMHDSSVSSLQFSETGDKIISGSYDETVKVWSIGNN